MINCVSKYKWQTADAKWNEWNPKWYQFQMFYTSQTSIDAFYVNDFRYKEERWWERAQIDRERMEENDPFILFFQELPVGDWVNFGRYFGIWLASM